LKRKKERGLKFADLLLEVKKRALFKERTEKLFLVSLVAINRKREMISSSRDHFYEINIKCKMKVEERKRESWRLPR